MGPIEVQQIKRVTLCEFLSCQHNMQQQIIKIEHMKLNNDLQHSPCKTNPNHDKHVSFFITIITVWKQHYFLCACLTKTTWTS